MARDSRYADRRDHDRNRDRDSYGRGDRGYNRDDRDGRGDRNGHGYDDRDGRETRGEDRGDGRGGSHAETRGEHRRAGGREERRQSERHSRDEREQRESRGYGRDDRDGGRARNARRAMEDGRAGHGGRSAGRNARSDDFDDLNDLDDFDDRDIDDFDSLDDSDGRDGGDAGWANDWADDWDEACGDAEVQRAEVRCPVAKRCGGCEWLAMPYETQLARKQDFIEELFSRIKCEVEPIVGMDEPWGYRNKVQPPFAPGQPNREGRTTARWGIFERGTHHIVPCRECLVEDERARPIIATVADLLPRFNIKPYSEKTGDGLLRYALVRTAHATGQVMLTLVCNGTRLPSSKAFLDRLLKAHPEIATVVLNVNRERTNVILGKEEKVLFGPGYIEDELCGCRFRISSSSFYQTNPIAAEKLYELAVEMADLKPGDRVGDAYCGTGTIGIVAAKASGARLLGVERNGDAVEDARENALLNGIEDAEFVTGDAGSVFARMARAGESLDVVFMDPPRAGSNQAFLANLSRLAPRRVVYISCEPRTQVRDIAALTKNGYRVERIRPVDMFPHTDHVESVVLLTRPKLK